MDNNTRHGRANSTAWSAYPKIQTQSHELTDDCITYASEVFFVEVKSGGSFMCEI